MGTTLLHAQRSVRFAVIGDFGDDSVPEAQVAALVDSWEPDLVVTVGDNNYIDHDSDTIDRNIGKYYHRYIFPYRGSYGEGADENRFFPSLGNHDWDDVSCTGDGCTGSHFDYFDLPGNERYYDFERGPVHFFVLNSVEQEPDGISESSEQARWLREGLEASEACWKVVVMHHPPYTSGSRNPPLVEMRWPYKEWGAHAHLTGHNHHYERIILDEFPYFINGAGGRRDLYPFGAAVPGSAVRHNGNYGAQRVEANCTSLAFEYVTIDGTVIDEYILRQPSVATLTQVAVEQVFNEAVLQWETDFERGLVSYVVEKVLENGDVVDVATVEPSNTADRYERHVVDLPSGLHTYRIRWEGEDGLTGFSEPRLLVMQALVEWNGHTGTQAGEGTVFEWYTDREYETHRFYIEREVEPGRFVPEDTLATYGPSEDRVRYQALVEEAPAGRQRFRIRWTGADGREQVSEVIEVDQQSELVLGEVQSSDQQYAVRLQWQTDREVYIDRFEVETEGPDGAFVRLRTVPAQGSPGRGHEYSYLVDKLEPGPYPLRLRWYALDGETGVTATLDANALTSVDHEAGAAGFELALRAPYPNPFADHVRMPYELDAAAFVRLVVVDALGREMAVVEEGMQAAGRYEAVYTPSGLPPGVYFAVLTVEGRTRLMRPMVRRR